MLKVLGAVFLFSSSDFVVLAFLFFLIEVYFQAAVQIKLETVSELIPCKVSCWKMWGFLVAFFFKQ